MSPTGKTPDVRAERNEPQRVGAEQLDALIQAAKRAGHVVIPLDLRSCADKATLLTIASAAFDFPHWFGHNWDAFFDCLVDLASARRATGCVIILRNAAAMREHAPEALDTALGILEDAAKVWERRGVAMRTFIDVAVPDAHAQP